MHFLWRAVRLLVVLGLTGGGGAVALAQAVPPPAGGGQVEVVRAFFAALRTGDVATVEQSLAADATLCNAVQDEKTGTPALMAAIAARQHAGALAKLLLAKGANVNGVDRAGATPLHRAVEEGEDGLVALLIANGARVNAQDEEGRTPLLRAVDLGGPMMGVESKRIVAALLAHGADPNLPSADERYPLLAALNLYPAPDEGRGLFGEMMSGMLSGMLSLFGGMSTPKDVTRDVVTQLLDHGATWEVTAPGERGALHGAARLGDLKLAKRFIALGADVTAADAQHMTALHYAALAGKQEMLAFLVGKGLAVHAAALDGSTPLLLAARAGRSAAVAYLLKKGADPRATDVLGRTALHLAAGAGRSPGELISSQLAAAMHPGARTAQARAEVVHALLGKKVAVNAPDARGRTALHYAAACGDRAVCSALLRAKADRSIKDAEGQTARDLAAAQECREVVALLDAGR